MTLQEIKRGLESQAILFSEDRIHALPTVIGYDKTFKWRWFATQLNTFIVAVDFGDRTLSIATIEEVSAESFAYAQKHYTGWPRGLQSGLGVITLLLSSRVDQDAIDFCRELKSGKKWAGFVVPVVMDSSSGQVYCFDREPVWGRIYYPHFKDLIRKTTIAVSPEIAAR